MALTSVGLSYCKKLKEAVSKTLQSKNTKTDLFLHVDKSDRISGNKADSEITRILNSW